MAAKRKAPVLHLDETTERFEAIASRRPRATAAAYAKTRAVLERLPDRDLMLDMFGYLGDPPPPRTNPHGARQGKTGQAHETTGSFVWRALRRGRAAHALPVDGALHGTALCGSVGRPTLEEWDGDPTDVPRCERCTAKVGGVRRG